MALAGGAAVVIYVTQVTKYRVFNDTQRR